jgi:hypothetical protein
VALSLDSSSTVPEEVQVPVLVLTHAVTSCITKNLDHVLLLYVVDTDCAALLCLA